MEVLLLFDATIADPKDCCNRTPFSYAAEEENLLSRMKLLFETGEVDPNSVDQNNRTPLSYAAEWGRLDVVQYLLNICHVNVDKGDINGRTPLSFAIEHGQKEVVALLKGSSSTRDESGTQGTAGKAPMKHAGKLRGSRGSSLSHPQSVSSPENSPLRDSDEIFNELGRTLPGLHLDAWIRPQHADEEMFEEPRNERPRGRASRISKWCRRKLRVAFGRKKL